jgi:hypothetical protein
VSSEDVGAELRIVRGSPSDAEIAAVTAVIRGVLDELAAAEETRSAASTTAWQRSQRPLRSPLTVGAGSWRSFSA